MGLRHDFESVLGSTCAYDLVSEGVMMGTRILATRRGYRDTYRIHSVRVAGVLCLGVYVEP